MEKYRTDFENLLIIFAVFLPAIILTTKADAFTEFILKILGVM